VTFLRRPARAAAAALALAAILASASPAGATTNHVGKGLALSPYESRLLTLINHARARAGLRSVTAEPGSTDVARRWSLRLATNRTLGHNPDLVLDMSSDGSRAWRHLAENVGEGGAGRPDDLFRAYMASPLHRANILSRTTRYVGIGTVTVRGGAGSAAGVAWNTLTFVDAYSSRYGKAHTTATTTMHSSSLPVLAGRWRVTI
jgi:uncharacterized protein YkwD